MTVAVIGAGPTGLTVGHRLACAGVDVEVFEAAPQPGGLARSLELWGRPVDLGSHVFSTTDPRVKRLWLRLLGNDVRWLRLRRGVFTGDAVVQYPVRASDVLRKQSFTTSVRCGFGLLRQRLARSPGAPPDAEAWTVRRYGRPLFERYFEQYAVKLWGVPCADVDAEFARFLFQESSSVFDDDRFPYPSEGTGSVWLRMAEEFTASGGRLLLGAPIRELRLNGGRVDAVVTEDAVHPTDHLVSTMPLPQLLRLLPDVPTELARSVRCLRMRSTVLVYLRLANADLFDSHWLYVYPQEYRIGRVTNIDIWHETAEEGFHDDSVVCVEFWCDHADDTWNSPDSDLAGQAGDELVRTGLVGRAEILGTHVVRLRSTHPVPALGHRDVLTAARAHVDSVAGISSIGRHGQFAIPGVGACMQAAFQTADALLGAGRDAGTV